MKVVYIYREHRVGAFSIEKIFKEIAAYNKEQNVEVFEYHASKRSNLLIDIFNLRKMNADIYHITGDVHYFGIFLPKDKTVLTIHDLGHLLSGLSGVKCWLYKMIWFTLPLHLVSQVTVISEKTARDLLSNFSFIKNRLTVVPNFYSKSMRLHPRSFNVDKPQILHIGTKKNKNLSNLILALHGLSCRLLIVGAIPPEIKGMLSKFEIDYLNLINITDEQVYNAYVESDLVAFISTFEGFGMPILESQVVGRPLITSNISPMCDIAGSNACLVDPFDVDEIREKIIKLVNDEEYRNSVVLSGIENAKLYSIEEVSQKYLAVYHKLLLDNVYA